MKQILMWAVLVTAPQVHGATVWQELRQNSLLTDQTSITNRNDLCGAAAAVNLAQGLAKQMNRAPIKNPHELFESIVTTYPGVNDVIGLSEVTQTLRKVLTRVFPQDQFKIDAKLLDYYHYENMTDVHSTEQITENDLIPAPNELKILDIYLFDETGKPIGGHAIVVDSMNAGELKFVNSFEPLADSRATMFDNLGSMWKGHQIPTFMITSPTPKVQAMPHEFLISGVITVRHEDTPLQH